MATTTLTFADRLATEVERKRSQLVVGLDPQPELLPVELGGDVSRFCCGIIDAVVFDDHAGYGEREIKDLVAIAKKLDASGFVTTEKDAVKLTPGLRDRLESVGPVVVARLDVELVDEEDALAQMISMVGGLDRRRR